MEPVNNKIFVKLSTENVLVFAVEENTNRLESVYDVENVGPVFI